MVELLNQFILSLIYFIGHVRKSRFSDRCEYPKRNTSWLIMYKLHTCNLFGFIA